MKYAFRSALALLAGVAVSSIFAAACGGYPELNVGNGFEPGVDAGPDVVDAGPPMLGPTLVVDDMHIAGFMEDKNAFSLIGMLLNPQLKMGIENGTMLLGLEMRGLDDPSGQADPELTIGMYNVSDADNDPANNFNPDAPGEFNANGGPGGMNAAPLISYEKVSITGGKLHAEGVGSLMMPGFPLPLGGDQTLDGQLVPTQDNEHIRTLEGGRMVTVLAASMLQNLPNIFGALGGMGGMGGMQCQGQNFLDAIATGCGFLPFQPDADIDGDGLEKFYDTEGGDPDAGTLTDGHIDKCVDGDGTEILGPDCVSDPRIKDGYKMIFVVHGVRAIVYVP
jgi:hypothetical protein